METFNFWLVKKVVSLSNAKVYVFSDSVLGLGKMSENHNQILSERTSWRGSKVHHNTELWTQLMVSQWNSSGILSQDSPHRSSATKVQEFVSKMSEAPEDFTGRIIFMSMFNDITWRSKDNEQECELSAQLVSIYANRFSPGRWSFLGPGSEKKWYSTHESKPQGEWDGVEELMMITFSESGHPVFRSTSPLSRGTLSKAKVVENYQCTSALTGELLKLFLAQLLLWISSVFTEQSQICVKNTNLAMLEEGELSW